MKAIIPFTQVWYKNCFYHALFTIVSMYDREYKIFLQNDFYKYNYNRENFELDYVEIATRDVAEDLKEIGIGVTTERPVNDIIFILINYLQQGKLLIVNIDKNVLQNENYNEDIACHSIMVYGYDEEKKCFNILENRYVNSSLFEVGELEEDKLQIAYSSFVEALTHYKYGIYIFEEMQLEKGAVIDCKACMRNYIMQNASIRKNSLEVFRQFVEDVQHNITNKEELELHLDHLMKICNQVIVGKKIEIFSFQTILGADAEGINDIFSRILEKWKFIRTCFFQYQMRRRYREETITKIIQSLCDIEKVEWEAIRYIEDSL